MRLAAVPRQDSPNAAFRRDRADGNERAVVSGPVLVVHQLGISVTVELVWTSEPGEVFQIAASVFFKPSGPILDTINARHPIPASVRSFQPLPGPPRTSSPLSFPTLCPPPARTAESSRPTRRGAGE